MFEKKRKKKEKKEKKKAFIIKEKIAQVCLSQYAYWKIFQSV